MRADVVEKTKYFRKVLFSRFGCARSLSPPSLSFLSLSLSSLSLSLSLSLHPPLNARSLFPTHSQRISAANQKEISRTLVKFCVNNPSLVFYLILDQMKVTYCLLLSFSLMYAREIAHFDIFSIFYSPTYFIPRCCVRSRFRCITRELRPILRKV